MIRALLKALTYLALLAIILPAAWLAFFAYHAHTLPSTPLEFEIRSGSSSRAVAQQLAQQGAVSEPWSFVALTRLFGKASQIKTGVYELNEATITPLDLLARITRGDASMSELTFIEGHTFAQMREALDRHPDVKHTMSGMSDAEILQQVGASERHPEGLFFPDTYFFSKGMTDIAILKRAYRSMHNKVQAAWEGRDPSLPYTDAYQALIMASIIEKETGRAAERPLVSAVFVNRLRRGMKLQTDPTVIYGMGARYAGNLRRRDLTTDTEYNTYTRTGLPPTPIAMPGLTSIQAAMNPVQSSALYFVAKGDGSHQFSKTLDEHNRAVNRFQK